MRIDNKWQKHFEKKNWQFWRADLLLRAKIIFKKSKYDNTKSRTNTNSVRKKINELKVLFFCTLK